MVLGADFSESSLADLEWFARASDGLLGALARPRSPIAGAVVLSTCNRFEVYVETDSRDAATEFVLRTLRERPGGENVAISEAAAQQGTAQQQGVTQQQGTTQQQGAQLSGAKHPGAQLPARHLYARHGEAVAQHLFSVAAGLESMIVGEDEISGQVKRALAQAQSAGTATKHLNTLFQAAASVSKRVHAGTELGVSGRSVINNALDIAAEHLGVLRGTSVLLIGTGAYSRVVLAALARSGVTDIGVYSRTGRAEQFTASRPGVPVPEAELLDWLARVDLVVSASGTGEYVIDAALARRFLARRQHALVCVDVALTRDIAPAVAQMPGCVVIDLEQVRSHAPCQYVGAVDEAHRIVREAVQQFESERRGRSVDPLVQEFRARVAALVAEEVQAVSRRSGEALAAEVQRSLRRISNSLLHTPTVRAKQLAAAGKRDEFAHAAKLLFDFEVDHAD